MRLEVLELKLGIRLLQLVQGNSELLDKIKAIRKTIASELGFIIPKLESQMMQLWEQTSMYLI